MEGAAARPEERLECLRCTFESGFQRRPGRAFLLGLDNTCGLPVDKQEVVSLSKAASQSEFADGNATAGVDIGVGPVLNEPSSGSEHAVDGLAGFLFRCKCHEKASL